MDGEQLLVAELQFQTMGALGKPAQEQAVDPLRLARAGAMRAEKALLVVAENGNDAAVPVYPKVVAESDRVDDQRVARPRGRGVSLPRRIWILRQRTAIREYLAVNAIHLVEHQEKTRRLDKLHIVRQPVRTQKKIGKTPDVWITFRLICNALFNQCGKPRLVR
jgi:hypothetical protein